MKDIEEVCDRILILMGGKLIKDCSVDKLKKEYEVVDYVNVTFKNEIPIIAQEYKVSNNKIRVPKKETEKLFSSLNVSELEEIIFDIFNRGKEL